MKKNILFKSLYQFFIISRAESYILSKRIRSEFRSGIMFLHMAPSVGTAAGGACLIFENGTQPTDWNPDSSRPSSKINTVSEEG